MASATADPDETDVESLIADLDDLAADVESTDTYDEIRQTQELLVAASEQRLIDSGVRRLRPSDAVEALVGSVIFASPLLVEDGVFDIAAHLFGYTIAGIPIFLVANTAFVVFMTYALLEWTGREKVESRNLLGIIPVRIIVILSVSFLVVTVLMTVWGRVGDWQPPSEAIARINVLWTVGSLGAALGDILSNNDTGREEILEPTDRTEPRADRRLSDHEEMAESELIASLHDQFDDLEAVVYSEENRREVEHIRERTRQATAEKRFGKRIRKYTSRDIAEAFVGSIFFSIPFLVEDGVFDVADYFLSFRVGEFPVFFVLNTAFVLLMVTLLVYWAGPQNVQMSRPLFGFVPRRLVGIALVSFLTAAALMTMWGRVDHWRDPVVAVARISAVWTVASFGAALGDILPGESSGDDIYEDLADLGERIEEASEAVGGDGR